MEVTLLDKSVCSCGEKDFNYGFSKRRDGVNVSGVAKKEFSGRIVVFGRMWRGKLQGC